MFLPAHDPNFTDRSRAILQEMAEVGLGMVFKIGAEHENLGEMALAYSRVTKAVRQSIAMEARVAEGELVVHRRQAAEHQTREAQNRKVLIRERTDDIERRIIPEFERLERLDDWTEADEVDPLIDELGEILGYHTQDADFLDRPVADIIAEICQELEIPIPELPCPVAEVARSASDETEGADRAEASFFSAHPGECRDPGEAHEGLPDESQLYDLGPGIRRDERDSCGP